MPASVQFAERDLRRTLMAAHDWCDIWWLLDGEHPERVAIIKASKRYWAFFEPLLPGMRIAFLISLCSIFEDDQKQESITLKCIPELAADSAFADLWRKGRCLYKYRSKVVAHRDRQNEATDFAAATGLTYNDIKDLVKDVCAIFDRYALKKGLEPIVRRSPSPTDDLMRAIRRLAE